MPAKTEKQAIAARIALAAKKGKIPKSELKGASKQMAKGMSKETLKHFTKVKESFENRLSHALGMGIVMLSEGKFEVDLPEDLGGMHISVDYEIDDELDPTLESLEEDKSQSHREVELINVQDENGLDVELTPKQEAYVIKQILSQSS